MATSETEIANLALGHLGQSVEISNLRTQRTPAAIALRTIYDTCRRMVFRATPWSFAHKIGALGLVSTYGVDDGHPTSEWKYAYERPSDAVMFRKIQSGIRNENRQSRIPYKESRGFMRTGGGIFIFTDQPEAIGEWTVDVTDPSLYPDDFVMALSLCLATYAAPKITGEDPFKMGDRARGLYQFEIGVSRTNNAAEVQEEEAPDSELERART